MFTFSDSRVASTKRWMLPEGRGGGAGRSSSSGTRAPMSLAPLRGLRWYCSVTLTGLPLALALAGLATLGAGGGVSSAGAGVSPSSPPFSQGSPGSAPARPDHMNANRTARPSRCIITDYLGSAGRPPKSTFQEAPTAGSSLTPVTSLAQQPDASQGAADRSRGARPR